MSDWISVRERLPEVRQEVLVYWRNTSQKAEHFELTHYTGDHWYLLDNTGRPWIEVVAWMPLFAPPDCYSLKEEERKVQCKDAPYCGSEVEVFYNIYRLAMLLNIKCKVDKL